MNELQKVRNHIISKFDTDALVNTITTVSDELIDTNKETIYPVVNIDYIDSDIQEDVILFSYHITILDQNDVYVKSTDSKLLEDTNQSDILNETFNIAQSFINSFRQYNNDDIEIFSKTNVTSIMNERLNGLSGHEFDIILSIPNEGSICP
jgi:hypothetical protein